MKKQTTIVTKSLRAAGFAALLPLIGSTQAAVIHGVGDASSTGLIVTTFAGAGVDSTSNSYTSGAIAGAVDGVNFTYTIAFTGSMTTLGIRDGFDDLTSGTGDQFVDGDSYTVAIAVIGDDSAGLDVVFDGFVGFGMNRVGPTEGQTVNGVSYGGATGAYALTGSPESAFSAVSNGTTNTDYVDFQFSTAAVPEPSSTALLGLGGLALILRRRK